MGVEIEKKKAFIERETARLTSLEETRVRLVTELSRRQQQLEVQKKELDELCKAMANDAELPDMAIDSDSSGLKDVVGAGLAVDKSHMQELEMFRILFNQMNNPDPEPETQELLVRKHKAELDCIVAKRQKTQG